MDERFRPDLQTLVGFWWPKIQEREYPFGGTSRHSVKSELGVAITTSKAQRIKTGRLYHSLHSQGDLVAVTMMGQWRSHLFWVVQGPLTPLAGVIGICRWLPRLSQKGASGWDMGPSQQPSLTEVWVASVLYPEESGSPSLTAGKLGSDAHLRANGLSWSQRCFCWCDRMRDIMERVPQWHLWL